MKRTSKEQPQTDRLSALQRENSELKRRIDLLTNEVLSVRESETRFREIVERSYDVIFVMNLEGTITFVSQSISGVLGFSPRQVIGTSAFDYLSLAGQNSVRDNISRILAGEDVPNFQVSVHRKDGSTAALEANFTPIVKDGETIGIQGIARDLTARKSMEQALKDSNEKYRLVVENAHDAITITQNGVIKYANPRAREISGYTLDELTALSSYLDIVHPDDRLTVFQQEAYRWENNLPMHGYEFRIIDKSGSEKHIFISAVFIIWEEQWASLEFIYDITKQKKTEAALKHTADQYRMVVENAYEAITITQDGVIKYANPRTSQVIGYSTEELISLPSYMDLIHPDDRQRVKENENIWRNETDIYRYDFRIITKDGETRWVEINAVNIEWDGRHASLDFLTDVTDRTLVKNALRESEEKYRLVVENAYEAITITQDYMIKYANPRALEMTGYSLDEMKSGSYMDFIVHPDDRKRIFEHDNLRTDQKSFNYGFRFITKYGLTRWAEVNTIFIQWEGREASLDFTQDVTNRKLAESALRESEEKYRLVSENANEGIMIIQDGILQYVNPKSLSITGFSEDEALGRSFLDFLHPDDIELVLQTHQKRLTGGDVPDHYSFRIIDKSGRTRWIDNHPVVMNWMGKVAVLNFITDITERKNNEEELHQYRNHLEELVSQRTTELSETNNQLILEIRDRKQAEDALIQSEKKYRELIGNIDDIIYVVDHKGRILYTNDAFERISGYRETELVGRGFSDLIVSDSYARAEEIYRKQLAGEDVGTFELEFFANDGRIIVLEIRERLVWNNDRVVEIHGIGRDVTEKKWAEEALRRSEEKYRLVVENAQEAITVTQNGIIRYANPRALEIGGYDTEELLTLPYMELVHPEDRMKVLSQDANRSLEDAHTYDFRMLTKDGTVRWIELNAITIEWEGEVASLDMFNDITERKEAEQRLAESEARYRELVENINEVLFNISVDGSITYISPAIERILGATQEEFVNEGYHHFIHPDDLPELQEKVRRTRIGEQEPVEFRMLAIDGDIRHIRTSARLHTENGVPKSLIGVATDITAEKEALENLERSRTQLDAQYRSIPIPTYTWRRTDDDFTLIDCNDAAIEITKGGITDFIGTRFSKMYEDDPQTRKDIHRCFTEKELITREMNYHFKTTNEPRHLIVYYAYVPQDLVLVHTMDITDRKIAEKWLADSEARYRAIVEDQTELVCRFKKDGTLTFVNPALCRYYNTHQDKLLGKKLPLFSHDEDRKKLIEYFSSFTKDEPIRNIEHRIVLPDGTVRWQHWSDRALFDESGSLIEFQSTGRDITERIHAEQELIRAKNELDDKVKERTINLNEAKEKLERELAERLVAEKNLKESREEAQMLSKKLLTVQEDERKRIAQELHDSIGQSLSTIKFQVENTYEELSRSNPQSDTTPLRQLVPAIQGTIQEIREIVKNLRPSLLDDLGILATISWFVRNFTSNRPGIQVDSHLYIHEHEIPEHLKIIIYRILQESFNNIAKHGHADQITLLLRKNNGNIELSIEDNGRGFDETKIGNLEKFGLAFGLTSMRERVIFSGGAFKMSSEEGEGTIIQASWPHQDAPLTQQDLS